MNKTVKIAGLIYLGGAAYYFFTGTNLTGAALWPLRLILPKGALGLR